MIPYQKEKAHEDEYGHCGHGHRVWHQAGDVVVHGIQGFQEHLFPEALLCFRKRDRRGERQRLSELRCVQLCLGPLSPSEVPTKEQTSSGRGFIARDAWCLLGQASSQVSTDMKQTLILLGNNKGFLTLVLRHSLGYFGWRTFYLWYRLGWPALRFTPCKP